ncbi:restriction endonuclease subunit S [Lactobacillus delbrueckii subsp. bulgaricus]|uniref:restriction endonuclease subunit S n=1 Tax=Lactobacillus delbrueckii TaxID=1584 RepID=UPI001C3555FC|nr:restriction endonuclease subunit S [Lactobacillus delbrueckii]MBT8923844.1 restriction endonuclease subunit S [Lactobacillus delbrueckii subsp. bulgaricus]MCD5480942.1 restriction endonuclease subunit S [Lactobacillus delbrueckii subsp. bulgaricus]
MTKYKLAQLAEIKYGKDHKKLGKGSVPVYGTGGIMRYVNDFIYEGESVLIPRKGSLNNLFYVHGKFWTVDTIFWTKIDSKIVLPRYLYYYLSRIDLTSYNVGSAVPSLTISLLNELVLDIPPISVQKDVVNKLTAIENKIKINEQINDNLVELLDLQYNKLITSSTLEVHNIQHIGSVTGGGTPSKKVKEYWNGEIPWITPKDLSQTRNIFTSNGSKSISNVGFKNSSTKLLPAGSILYSSRAPIGYISIANNPVTTNQGFKSIIPDKEYPTEFIFELLKNETSKIVNSATGSTFKEVSSAQLKNHEIKIPCLIDCKKFGNSTRPFFNEIRRLECESNLLLKVRSLLLSRYF